MRRRPVVLAPARACATLALLALGACVSRDSARDSARVADSTARASAQPQNPPAPSGATIAKLPGELTKPLDQYSGDELYDLVHRIEWSGGSERERKCTGDPACDGTPATRFTSVRVDAVTGQDSISATGVAANGVVAIRALNNGALAEARYGFKPGKNLEYYLVVLPGDAKAGRWQLEELDSTQGARRHTRIGGGPFTPCNHPFQAKRVIRASFYTCADSHMQRDSVQKSGLLMFDPRTDPIWGGCAQGCCIADG